MSVMNSNIISSSNFSLIDVDTTNLKSFETIKFIALKRKEYFTNTRIKRRKTLALSDFSFDDRHHLQTQVIHFLTIFIEDQDTMIFYKDSVIHASLTIKYLHFFTRFRIEKAITELFLIESSKTSKILIINLDIIRVFCEFARKFTKNKMWRNFYKMIAEKSCYLLIVDSSIEENFDFVMTNSNELILMSAHQITNVYEFRIFLRNVWFISSLFIIIARNQLTHERVKAHWTWRINAHRKYFRTYATYV